MNEIINKNKYGKGKSKLRITSLFTLFFLLDKPGQ
jgi:hypothetical protein